MTESKIEKIIRHAEHGISRLCGRPVKLAIVSDETPSADQIAQYICTAMEINWNSVMSGHRGRQKYAVARHLYCYICRITMKEPFGVIGERIRRHHTTVMYAVQKTGEMLEVGDELYSEPYKKVMEELSK